MASETDPKPSVVERTLTRPTVMKGTKKARDGARAIKTSTPGVKVTEAVKRGVETKPAQKAIDGMRLAKEVVTLEAALDDVRKVLADLTAVAAVQHAELKDLQSRVTALEADPKP